MTVSEFRHPTVLIRYDIFFVMRLATREVRVAGIVPTATGVWMEQVARNLTDPLDGFLRDCRFLIQDLSSRLFNLVTGRYLVGERYNAPIDLRATAPVPDLRMHVISEIERGRIRR